MTQDNSPLACHVHVGIILRARGLPHLQLKLIIRIIRRRCRRRRRCDAIFLAAFLATKGQCEGVGASFTLTVDSGLASVGFALTAICRSAVNSS